MCQQRTTTHLLTQRHEESSGDDLTLDPVVEFSSSAQQQVDPGAEGGISGQEQGGQSALCLCPHATQQLFEGKLVISQQHIGLMSGLDT